jgi:hypothetical protein
MDRKYYSTAKAIVVTLEAYQKNYPVSAAAIGSQGKNSFKIVKELTQFQAKFPHAVSNKKVNA